MLCFWGMQRLFCSLIYHSRDLPILFLTKENYDSSCHRQTSHVSFLSSQVSHKLYLIIEFHELLRNGAKESGNREQHWILFLCEVRDRSEKIHKSVDTLHLSMSFYQKGQFFKETYNKRRVSLINTSLKFIIRNKILKFHNFIACYIK